MGGTAFVRPWGPVEKSGLLPLIAVDDFVSANQYGASGIFDLTGPTEIDPDHSADQRHTGRLVGFTIHSKVLGTGAVQTPPCKIIFFGDDPGLSAGDPAMSDAAHSFVLAIAEVFASDWNKDGAGAEVTIPLLAKFEKLPAIYYSVRFAATANPCNDAAGDDEQLDLRVRWQVES